MEKSHFPISVFLKGAAAIAFVYGMSSSWNGMMMLTLFTNLSNLFATVMLLVSLVYDVREFAGRGKARPQGVYLAKQMSVMSVVLGFLVSLEMIVPADGLDFFGACASSGSYLCLLTPVLAVADYLLFDGGYQPRKRHVLYSAIPPASYFGFVILLHECFGITWDGMAAPYRFLNYSAPTGWFGFDITQIGPQSLGIGVAYMAALILLNFMGLTAIFSRLAGILGPRSKA